MNDKLNTQDIIDALAQKHGINKKEAGAFIKELFLLIEHTLEKDKIVKLKGFGTFKIIKINARESVNVNTGERFTIQEHNKIGFVPDAELRNLLNEPFALFETVVLENTNEKEENAENRNKHHSATPKKKLPVFIACGIAIILSGAIILYILSSGDEQPKETTPPAIPVSNNTTEIPPVDTYSMEEDLRIQNDTSPVNPDSVNYAIIGTKTTYAIKKGETLTKVSLRFYGTKDLWPYIQKHNHPKIKNPGMITPGMILTIPELKKKDP
jgi:nucleoid DNA-binding protein